MHYKELIEIIKNRRVDLNINQVELAQLSGVGLRTIKQFESGKGNPTLSTISQIAEVLGLELGLAVKKMNHEES
jgi:transcriptional regulator with XRE-family HTH domain